MASSAKLQSMVGPGKYDLVLRIDRFLDVFDEAKGWKLAVGAGSDERLEACTSVRIAPIGMFNVGKTWLISKLCEESPSVAAGQGLELACGDAVHTEGLSLKLCRINMQTLAVLDTPGVGSLVSISALRDMLACFEGNQAIAMHEALQDQGRKEDLVKRVAFNFAQHLVVVVVGQNSFADLKVVQLLDEVMQSAKNAQKQAIVVHNLKDMTYKQFKEEKDPRTGLTYLRSVEHAFGLQTREVAVCDGQVIDEGFNDSSMRHVFLTYDGPQLGLAAAAGRQRSSPQAAPADPGCRNRLVIDYLRAQILESPPSTTPNASSNIIEDLAAHVSRQVARSLRRPGAAQPPANVAIHYDKGNRRLVAHPQQPSDQSPPHARAVARGT